MGIALNNQKKQLIQQQQKHRHRRHTSKSKSKSKSKSSHVQGQRSESNLFRPQRSQHRQVAFKERSPISRSMVSPLTMTDAQANAGILRLPSHLMDKYDSM